MQWSVARATHATSASSIKHGLAKCPRWRARFPRWLATHPHWLTMRLHWLVTRPRWLAMCLRIWWRVGASDMQATSGSIGMRPGFASRSTHMPPLGQQQRQWRASGARSCMSTPACPHLHASSLPVRAGHVYTSARQPWLLHVHTCLSTPACIQPFHLGRSRIHRCSPPLAFSCACVYACAEPRQPPVPNAARAATGAELAAGLGRRRGLQPDARHPAGPEQTHGRVVRPHACRLCRLCSPMLLCAQQAVHPPETPTPKP
eukprot:366426-Chlamydomonas_euryale.AAC.2